MLPLLIALAMLVMALICVLLLEAGFDPREQGRLWLARLHRGKPEYSGEVLFLSRIDRRTVALDCVLRHSSDVGSDTAPDRAALGAGFPACLKVRRPRFSRCGSSSPAAEAEGRWRSDQQLVVHVYGVKGIHPRARLVTEGRTFDLDVDPGSSWQLSRGSPVTTRRTL
jgi:hypothetical protein